MKKTELRQGVAYYVNTTNTVSGYTSSYQRAHEINRSNRYFVIFENGEPVVPYRNNSAIKVSNCPTFGFDCPTHKREDNRLGCYSKSVRLMDIRGEYYATIQRVVLRYKERNADGGRGSQYLRHLQNKAQREKQAVEEPVKKELFALLGTVSGKQYIGNTTTLGSFTVEQMSAIIEALKTSQKVGA